MKIRVLTSLAALFAVSFAPAQAPWPLERQDRWGTAMAMAAPPPTAYTSPWIFQQFPGAVVSSATTLDSNGMGYYGTWGSFNEVAKINWQTGAPVRNFVYAPCTSCAAIGDHLNVYALTGGKVIDIDTSVMDFGWFVPSAGNDGSDWDHASANIGPDGNVIVGGNDGIAYRYNQSNGATVWAHPGLGNIYHTSCFTRDDSKVIFANGNHVTALNYADGSLAWDVPVGATPGGVGAAPDGKIVYGDDTGVIHGLDPDTGISLWTFSALGAIRAAVGFDNAGNAYLCSFDQRLYSIRTADGHRNWSFTGSGTGMTSPIAGPDGRIYFYERSGDFYCVNVDGNLIWQRHLNGQPRGSMSLAPDGTLFASLDTGMVMVRQTGYQLLMDSIVDDRGLYLGGGLTDLQNIDGSYLNYRSVTTTILSLQPVLLEFTAHTNYRPLSQFTINLDTGVSTPGLEQKVEMFNYNTGSFKTLDTRAATTSDTLLTLVVNSNANRFVHSTDGLMRIRVGYRKVGTTVSASWTTRIDRLTFDSVTPS